MKQNNITKQPTHFERYYPNISDNQSITKGWFSVKHILVPNSLDRRRIHGKWFRIQNGNKTIYRVLRFDPTLPGAQNDDKKKIVIDWGGWLDLVKDLSASNEVPKTLELEIKKASIVEILFRASVKHPEPSYRLSYSIAIFSLALGVISLAVALTSVFC